MADNGWRIADCVRYVKVCLHTSGFVTVFSLLVTFLAAFSSLRFDRDFAVVIFAAGSLLNHEEQKHNILYNRRRSLHGLDVLDCSDGR
jgi:hypothetical protein